MRVEHPTNIMAIENQVIQRLIDELPVSVKVEAMADFAELDITMWPAPAVMVIMGEYRPTGTAGPEVGIEQIIHVVPMVINAGDTKTGQDAKEQGGFLAAQCIAALHNWMPEDFYSELTLQPGNAIDLAAGRALFPLAFATTTTLLGYEQPYD